MHSPEFWDKIYRKNDGIIAREIAGEKLLVPIRGNLADMQRIFSLTPVADFIWEKLDGAQDLGNIRKQITMEYEVSQEQASSDIYEFVEQLIEFDLVTDISG
jgi:hypothetical protein